MTLGVVINTRSRQNRKRENPLPNMFAGDNRVVIEHMAGHGHEPLAAILRNMAAKGVETIVVSGGDGTVQGTLTELAEASPFSQLPRLALLAHGTTNMTAADVGLTLRNVKNLTELLEPDRHPQLSIRKRATVQVINPGGSGAQHGMFLGSGGIYRAVIKTHQKVLPLGLGGAAANTLAIAVSLMRAVFLRNRSNEDRVFQPTPMTIVADGRVFAEGDQFSLLVTTLDQLILKSNPFWNQSADNLRMTAVGYPLPKLVRSFLQVMYARDKQRLDPEIFRSASARTIDLTTPSPFTLDGEYLEMPAEGPLKIRRGPEFEFICGTL